MTRILFVEDEPRGVNPYFLHLSEKGIECVSAHNADEALERLQHEHFDLMSLDVMFDPGRAFKGKIEPQRSGLHLLERIRQGRIANCDPHLKVMVLTAVSNPAVEQKMANLGVIAYLKKPVPFDKVIATLLSAEN